MLGQKNLKVGHAGTLDDFAEGLLIIAIGRESTRQINFLMDLDKEYVVRAKLGELTDSLDCTGNVVEVKDNLKVCLADIEKAISEFNKSYDQIPPVYSALKFKGQPLYRLARYDLLDKKSLSKIAEQKKIRRSS